jgi:hypothetical protein
MLHGTKYSSAEDDGKGLSNVEGRYNRAMLGTSTDRTNVDTFA